MVGSTYAKNAEVSVWVKHTVVERAARAGINAGALMRMRWVITLKDRGALKARLVVQGFTDARLGKIASPSLTCSRRARQICHTIVACLKYEVHKGNVKQAILQGGDE